MVCNDSEEVKHLEILWNFMNPLDSVIGYDFSKETNFPVLRDFQWQGNPHDFVYTSFWMVIVDHDG